MTTTRTCAVIFVALLALAVSDAAIAGSIEDATSALERRDFTTALGLLQPLADRGEADAQCGLGAMYYAGYGVPQDDVAAVKWFRLAAEQGEAKAQYFLGMMCNYGRGVPTDNAEAVKWYRLAAEQGDVKAQNNLGAMYYAGLGVSQDYIQAYLWFNIAVAGSADSDMNAAEGRDKVAAKMTSVQLAEAQRLVREWRPMKTSQPSRP